MKKLSMEEKAQRYDEALERAKGVIEQNPLMEYLKKGIEYILPELKKSEESEDEKIMKAIHIYLDWLDGRKDYAPKGEYTIRDMIAWLEKQGKSKSYSWKPSKEQFEALDYAYNSCSDTERGNYYEGVLETLIEDLHRLENQGEQKSADNEPKFRKEDWIVHHGTENIYQVVAIIGNQYQLKYGDNYTVQSCADVDRCARLWDITKDAKVGDILVDGNLPFIFKKIDTNKYSYAYCGISVDDGFKIESDGESDEWTWMQDIKPATKEQRDTLIKAMTDAGYTFDFDKKELKKIEEEFNGEDYGIDSLWHAQNILERTLGCVEGYQSDDGILEHKCAITAVKKLYEQKSAAWCEENESHIRYLIECLEHCKKGVSLTMTTPTAQEYIDWLKSLRPQSQWKPSDNELEVLRLAAEKDGACLMGLYEQLKKLREE